ncbi:MAG: bifunctional DNA-formamidopyrimidine glycosylase/DNA-(apurinic or apyrimidinic site) lyase [Planctomycetota bacterium]
MPELPEVETVARGLRKRIVGLKIKGVRVTLPKLINLKPDRFSKALIGKTIKAVSRRAKVIIITLTNSIPNSTFRNLHSFSYLVVHLKMSGQLMFLCTADPVQKHTHVIIYLSNGHHLRFRDQRQFGYIRFYDTKGLDLFMAEHNFGSEPLGGLTLPEFQALIKSRPNSRIKPLLLDQTVIAGIGNLYADEILFYSGVHPLRRAGLLKPAELKKMYQGMQKILKKAIKERGSSIELYVDAQGRPGNYVKYIKAYDREGKPCLKCRSKITRIKIGSRSAYFCPRCQPR